MKLLTIGNAKTIKGEPLGYLTGILYLDPRLKGICPNASTGCKASCLFYAGRGRFSPVQEARRKKTLWLKNDQISFMRQLKKDIEALERKATREGKKPCVRLNGTSDINWYSILLDEWGNRNIFDIFLDIQFYDYTKTWDIVTLAGRQKNHYVNFSPVGHDHTLYTLLHTSLNIAVVFRNKLPDRYYGRPVLNGDEHDLRFLDPPYHVVGLRAKGKAKKDTTGFVLDVRREENDNGTYHSE